MKLRSPQSILTSLLLLTSFFPTTTTSHRTNRPVIGIFTDINTSQNEQYIAASYVKWLESAGARSVPIPSDADSDSVKAIFSQINGVLFPGGGYHEITHAKRKLWNLALEANKKGDYFPVWGTCLGFENLVTLASENDNLIQSGFNSSNITLALQFTPHASSSKLFANSKIRHILQTQNVTFNHHQYGIEPPIFSSNKHLTSFFRILSINTDRNGRDYVSSMESTKYPIYGVQWHPEKNNFEYGTVPGTDDIPYWNIDHSPHGVEVSFEMAKVFVKEVRKNRHLYVDLKLIWEYEMKLGVEFEQRFVIGGWGGEEKEEKGMLRGGDGVENEVM